MKIFFATLVLHNFFMSVPALAKPFPETSPGTLPREARAVAALGSLLSKEMSAHQFISKVRSQLPEVSSTFLKTKADILKKTTETHTFRIEKMGQREFLVKTDGQMAYVVVEDLEKGLFQINRKTVKLNFKASPEVLWKTIQTALNIPEKVSLFETLFLERAHAFNFMGALLGVALIGIIGYMYNQSNCSQYDSYASQCELASQNPGAVNTAELYYQARTFDSSWTNLSLGCGGSKERVRSCIPSLGSQINTQSRAPGAVQ